jgi:hypothetical protein
LTRIIVRGRTLRIDLDRTTLRGSVLRGARARRVVELCDRAKASTRVDAAAMNYPSMQCRAERPQGPSRGPERWRRRQCRQRTPAMASADKGAIAIPPMARVAAIRMSATDDAASQKLGRDDHSRRRSRLEFLKRHAPGVQRRIGHCIEAELFQPAMRFLARQAALRTDIGAVHRVDRLSDCRGMQNRHVRP